MTLFPCSCHSSPPEASGLGVWLTVFSIFRTVLAHCRKQEQRTIKRKQRTGLQPLRNLEQKGSQGGHLPCGQGPTQPSRMPFLPLRGACVWPCAHWPKASGFPFTFWWSHPSPLPVLVPQSDSYLPLGPPSFLSQEVERGQEGDNDCPSLTGRS